jgi:hypothetical protein
MILQNSLIVSGYNRFLNIKILKNFAERTAEYLTSRKKNTMLSSQNCFHIHLTRSISWWYVEEFLYQVFNITYSLLYGIYILSKFVIFNTFTIKDALSQHFQYSDTSQINNMTAFIGNQNNQFQLPPDWILWLEQN